MAVQTKGFGLLFHAARNSLIALTSFVDAEERISPDTLVGQFGEPALNQVEPAATGRYLVNYKARMLCEARYSCFDLGRFCQSRS